MAGFARWCFRHRRFVLLAWLIALVVVGGVARSVGSAYSVNFSFPATGLEPRAAHRRGELPGSER
jgi:RND superfamily putative drug exporter